MEYRRRTRWSGWRWIGRACAVVAIGASSVALAQEVEPAKPAALGLQLSVMPSGQLSAHASQNGMTFDDTADTDTATALAPFFDYALTRNFTLGVSPQVIFNVKGTNGNGSATEYDFRARITAQANLSPRLLVFGRVSPAYSIIDMPASFWNQLAGTGVSATSPKGFLVDASIGLNGQILPNALLGVDIGYQWGFQTMTATGAGGSVDFDLRTRYLHFGVGFAVLFGS
jgi:hypothetical protein